MTDKKMLKLTLYLAAFEVMVTGEKKEEFREDSEWIRSRLINSKTGKDKDYDFVEFTNGYGKDRPVFIAEYKGYSFLKKSRFERYSNGLKLIIKEGNISIKLGKVVEIKNYEMKSN